MTTAAAACAEDVERTNNPANRKSLNGRISRAIQNTSRRSKAAAHGYAIAFVFILVRRQLSENGSSRPGD